MDFLQLGANREHLIVAGQQKFAVPHDDGEHVVEVVRDAARQAPQGLHFLRVVELAFDFVERLLGEPLLLLVFLRLHRFGNVAPAADKLLRPALRVAHHAQLVVHPAPGAVRMSKAVLL